MNIRKQIILAAAAFALSGAVMSAHAQEKPEIGGNIMLGGGIAPEYEGSKDYKFIPMIMGKVEYDGYYLEAKGLGVRANVSPWEGIEFGPTVSIQGGRDSDVDNKYVAKMRKIDDAAEAGVFAKISTRDIMKGNDELSLEMEYSGDTGDVHEGYTVTLETSYNFFPVRKVRLGVNLSATYADENYTHTYFGVDADNSARSGLNRYTAKGGIKDVGMGLNAGYSFNKNWSVMGILKYKQLLGDAADSPVVDKDGSAGQVMAGAGVMFRF